MAINEKLLLNAILENVPDHVYFKDLQSKFLLVNNAMAKLLGAVKPEDVVGKSDFDFFSEEHAAQAYSDEQKIIQTGEPLVGAEEKETWPDGSITWVSSTKAPFRDAQGNIIGTFGISRDVTELKKARGVLEQSDRQRVMLESVGAICHHMGQPATVILTTAGLLSNKLKNSDESTKDMAKDIELAAEVLAEKLHKLNDLHEYRIEKYIDDINILEV